MLLLQGLPNCTGEGSEMNRIKLILEAFITIIEQVDGERSELVDGFNEQLSDLNIPYRYRHVHDEPTGRRVTLVQHSRAERGPLYLARTLNGDKLHAAYAGSKRTLCGAVAVLVAQDAEFVTVATTKQACNTCMHAERNNRRIRHDVPYPGIPRSTWDALEIKRST
jgi:hypothetical protein